jgi:metallophosphoesterase superfamily enzyme
MAIWVSSDWHCASDRLKQAVVNWITRGKEGNHRLIGNGDLFDILPWGKEKWGNAASIEQLATLPDGYPFDYVAGNHDPYKIIRKLMTAYPNIILRKRLEIKEGGRNYFITHGHRWALDWGFLGLRQ